jgi:hypothetical protein
MKGSKRTDLRPEAMLIVFIVFWCLAPPCTIGQKATRTPDASPSPLPPGNSKLSLEQEQALLLLGRVASELKAEADKPAAALIQAQVADTLWKFDELEARSVFRLAFDTVRQPIPETSTVDKEERARHLDLLKRQASALKEIISMFGKHDRATAEQWLESVNEEQTKKEPGANQLSPERAEFLAQLALQEVKTNPSDAQKLGLLSLTSSEIPSAFGQLLIALGNIDRSLSDVLFQGAIAALRRDGYPSGSILSFLSNYLFFSDGRLFARSDAPNASLFIDYLIEAANAQVAIWQDARANKEGIPQSGVSLVNFLAARGIAIVGSNSPGKLQILQPLLNELSNGLNQQQLDDMALMSTSMRQQNAMEASARGDLDTQIDRAEHEKDQVVRDYMWRMLAIGMMRGDPDRALTIAAKIDDESMRAQTQDDIYLVSVAERIRSSSYEDARQVALKFNDTNLRAKSLAEVADRAWSVSKDREHATDLLSEAYTIASKGEPTPDRAAITLLLAQKFAKLDLGRSFELLSAAIRIINQLQTAVATSPSGQTQRHGVRVISYTMVGGAELTTGEHATLDALTFEGLGVLVRSDYFRARNFGDDIQNKIVRARYLMALARGVLVEPGSKSAQSGRVRLPD